MNTLVFRLEQGLLKMDDKQGNYSSRGRVRRQNRTSKPHKGLRSSLFTSRPSFAPIPIHIPISSPRRPLLGEIHVLIISHYFAHLRRLLAATILCVIATVLHSHLRSSLLYSSPSSSSFSSYANTISVMYV